MRETTAACVFKSHTHYFKNKMKYGNVTHTPQTHESPACQPSHSGNQSAFITFLHSSHLSHPQTQQQTPRRSSTSSSLGGISHYKDLQPINNDHIWLSAAHRARCFEERSEGKGAVSLHGGCCKARRQHNNAEKCQNKFM